MRCARASLSNSVSCIWFDVNSINETEPTVSPISSGTRVGYKLAPKALPIASSPTYWHHPHGSVLSSPLSCASQGYTQMAKTLDFLGSVRCSCHQLWRVLCAAHDICWLHGEVRICTDLLDGCMYRAASHAPGGRCEAFSPTAGAGTPCFGISFQVSSGSNHMLIQPHLRSNWTETVFAVVAVLKGRGDAARAFIVGTIAISNLLVTGGCLLDQTKQGSEIMYPLLMALLHSRLVVGSIAFLLFPTILGRSFEGKAVSIALWQPAECFDFSWRERYGRCMSKPGCCFLGSIRMPFPVLLPYTQWFRIRTSHRSKWVVGACSGSKEERALHHARFVRCDRFSPFQTSPNLSHRVAVCKDGCGGATGPGRPTPER